MSYSAPNVSENISQEVSTEVDLDKLASAVARHETGNCTAGVGARYNNCFGIRPGNTAPCERVSSSRFCIYEKPEDSYEAFKKIWTRWYGGIPTQAMANKWTATDQTAWLKNVLHYYYS